MAEHKRHQGHRQRMRERVQNYGLDSLAEHEALEYVLYLFGLAFAFYPLVKWCRENEGFSWPWPHVQSEKKRIKELRREQESQEKAEQDSDKK